MAQGLNVKSVSLISVGSMCSEIVYVSIHAYAYLRVCLGLCMQLVVELKCVGGDCRDSNSHP